MPRTLHLHILRHLAAAIAAALLLAACQPGVDPLTPPDDAEAPANDTLPNDTQSPTSTEAETAETTDPTTAEPVSATLRVGLDGAPQSLDPLAVAPLDASGNDLMANLFSGLAEINPETGRVEPVLAESWEQQDDRLTWRVFLRDDVSWVQVGADGAVETVRPINAEDVVMAFQRACQDDGAAVGSSPLLYEVQGCREISQRDPELITPKFVEGALAVRVLNDVAVEIKLMDDSALLPTLLTLPAVRPVPADVIAEAGDAWTTLGTMLTSGPYALAVADDAGMTLVANPYWPLDRAGNAATVELSFADGVADAWAAGDLDAAVVAAGELMTGLPDGAEPRLIFLPQASLLAFNYEVPPLENVDVRRALSLALDREGIIGEVLPEYGVEGIAANMLTPPGTALAPTDAGIGTDPEAARAALEAAGYGECRGLPAITLLTDESALSLAIAERAVAGWQEVLGCEESTFTIEQQPLFDVLTVLEPRPAEVKVTGLPEPVRPGIVALSWQGDYPDTQHWLADLLGCRELFPGSFLDAQRECIDAEQLLAAAAGDHDDDRRAADYREVAEAFFGPEGEFPVIPVYHQARALAVQPWVRIPSQVGSALRFDGWTVAVDQQGE